MRSQSRLRPERNIKGEEANGFFPLFLCVTHQRADGLELASAMALAAPLAGCTGVSFPEI